MVKDVTIIKLGGSVITDKDKPLSVRKAIIQNAAEQVIRSKKKIILVHGGGSFGHPLAKKFKIISGIDGEIKNQNVGLAQTHLAMVKLNSIVIDSFLRRSHPAISVTPSSNFIKNHNMFPNFPTTIVEKLLSLNILPILYGDIILDEDNGFSIISGDSIILEICRNIQTYRVDKVIFCIEKDGLFGKLEMVEEDNPDKYDLIRKIDHSNLYNLKFPLFQEKIDVTGGIKGKLETAKKICGLNIPVQLVNGLKKEFIFKALMNRDVDSTIIS